MLRRDWKGSLRVQNERISVLSVIEHNPTKEFLQNVLLDVIEMWGDGIPSAQQCQAMQRLARALREEAR